MKKTCNRTIEASRADRGRTMSRRFTVRDSPFDVSGQRQAHPGDSACSDDVFLMNRFYGETVLEPVIAVLCEGIAGREGLTLAEKLVKEMQAKNGCIRGDVLWECLKNGLGTECAASLIAGLDGFNGLGLYNDRIVAHFAAGRKSPAGAVKPRRQQPVETGRHDRKEMEDAARGCRETASGKEKRHWRWKRPGK